MKSKKLIRSLLFSSVLSLLSVNSLGIFYTSNQSAQKRANKIKAASSQEIVLNVYNSEDYIAEEEKDDDGKVKTKAKKKKYITGAHGSGSARQKAKYREQRANRNKK